MRSISWFKTETVKYALYGFLFGLVFPIIATSIDIAKYDLPFSWKSAIYIQKKNPIHYIINTAPLFLGLFAMFGGRNLDKLRERNQEILKTSKFRHDFLANMSHEIRTPMVGIVGMIDLLFKNTKLDDLQKEYVTTIHQSSYNLLDILNQILDLSKIEAGKFQLSRKNVNLKQLIHQNVNLFLATAMAKGIYIKSEYDEELPENIIADGNRLTQIISNLIGNAIKFTYKGGVTIRAGKLSEKNGDIRLKIEVIDTGIGISKKDQKELFNRFSQFHQESIMVGEGSGLGLTTCKKLISLMDGKMGVISELEKGSNFWFSLKAKVSNVPAIDEYKPSIGTHRQNYNLHVLLVEDSDTSILVSTQILKYLGCSADIARSGRKALEMFQEDHYDLILMDINLPEMDGVTTCDMLRKNNKKIPPVIALTSNALPGDAERYIAQGLDDYITKPFTTETLNIKLRNWFGDHFEDH